MTLMTMNENKTEEWKTEEHRCQLLSSILGRNVFDTKQPLAYGAWRSDPILVTTILSYLPSCRHLFFVQERKEKLLSSLVFL